MKQRVHYRRGKAQEALTRLVAAVPTDLVQRLDQWGVAAEMPHRTAAIRFLLDKGLEAVVAQTAAGKASQA